MRLGIRAKLVAGFGAVLVLLGLVGIVGISSLAEVSDLSTDLYELHTLGLGHIMQANIDLIASGRAEKNAVLASDPKLVEKHAASSRDSLAAVSDSLVKFKSVAPAEAVKKLDDLEKGLAEMKPAVRRCSASPRRARMTKRSC